MLNLVEINRRKSAMVNYSLYTESEIKMWNCCASEYKNQPNGINSVITENNYKSFCRIYTKHKKIIIINRKLFEVLLYVQYCVHSSCIGKVPPINIRILG